MRMKLIDTRQLADFLGMSMQSVRNRAVYGDFPSVRIAGRYYFEKEAVLDHISNRKQKAYLEKRKDQNEEVLSLKEENKMLKEKIKQLENKLDNVAEMLK